MKVSVTKAASLAGVSRTTLYSDMDTGKLTFEQTSKNKRKIDVSELERVYGSLKLNDNKASTTVKSEQKLTKKSEQSSSDLTELAVLREKIDIIEKERTREREQYQEQIEQLSESLNKAQDNQSNTTRLLEHHTKNNGGDEFKSALKVLESRIANHEDEAKQKQEALKAEKNQLKRINKLYAYTGTILFIVSVVVTILVLIEQGTIQLN